MKVYDNFTSETGLARRFRVSDRVYKSLLFKLGFLPLDITFPSSITLQYNFIIILFFHFFQAFRALVLSSSLL